MRNPASGAAAVLLSAVFAVGGAFVGATLAAAAEDPNAGIEARVREVFADAPVMADVARCESGFRQFGPDGKVLRGGAGKGYLGVFQIGEKIHYAHALGLGMDVMTVEGNLAYARRLYDANGTVPWKSCLKAADVRGPVPAPVAPVAAAPVVAEPAEAAVPAAPIGAPAAPAAAPKATPITVNMNIGMTNAQVRVLQQQLNALGFTVAASGVGSAGNETTYFGSLTREAVRKFQCDRKIVCSGSESTTGYGRVGPMTRAALLAAVSAE